MSTLSVQRPTPRLSPRYAFLGELARGPRTMIVRAYNGEARAQVAIKTLRPEREMDQDLRARVGREAKDERDATREHVPQTSGQAARRSPSRHAGWLTPASMKVLRVLFTA